ncbi:MAG: efflux RND transporter periplasmic adaptor subunit [Desulfomonilaceae bacterium]|nr:efflux RND transporter periplasmic adaptor subunit [Desulfomonilaceae bacterium]
MGKREFIVTCVIVILGALAAVLMGMTEKKPVVSFQAHGHGHGEEHGHDHSHDLGPNGGKVLKDGPFEVELLIFEKGTEPHFRAYVSNDGKPVDLKEVTLSVELERLGDRVTVFDFTPGADYLFCIAPVEEPHSFFVKALAEWRGQEFDWQYTQYEARLTLPPALAKSIGIESSAAGPGTIKSTLDLPGEIALNADRVSHVVPRVPGVVSESRKNLGDPIRKGEVLAIIDSRELGEAKSNYLVALEREKLARYNFERSETLWKKQIIPEKEFLTAQKSFLEEKIQYAAAGRKLKTLGLSDKEIVSLADGSLADLTRFEIRAALDGVVVRKHLSPGEWVKEDAEIFTVADLSDVWVDITVYPQDLRFVGIGQKALVMADASGLQSEGTVSYVGPLVGEESRTAKARVVIPNPKGMWRPGIFVKVRLTHEERAVPVVVRNEAIQRYRDWTVVFVNYGDEYEVRPVELGLSDGEFTDVRKGLSPGEPYVDKKSFILKAELEKSGIAHEH